jgi:hypothetical protein
VPNQCRGTARPGRRQEPFRTLDAGRPGDAAAHERRILEHAARVQRECPQAAVDRRCRGCGRPRPTGQSYYCGDDCRPLAKPHVRVCRGCRRHVVAPLMAPCFRCGYVFNHETDDPTERVAAVGGYWSFSF